MGTDKELSDLLDFSMVSQAPPISQIPPAPTGFLEKKHQLKQPQQPNLILVRIEGPLGRAGGVGVSLWGQVDTPWQWGPCQFPKASVTQAFVGA